MPIALQISHPDRILIGIVRGAITPQNLDSFMTEIAAAKALRYRKIIRPDGRLLRPDGRLAAFRARVRQMALPPKERGPIALVADRSSRPSPACLPS